MTKFTPDATSRRHAVVRVDGLYVCASTPVHFAINVCLRRGDSSDGGDGQVMWHFPICSWPTPTIYRP